MSNSDDNYSMDMKGQRNCGLGSSEERNLAKKEKLKMEHEIADAPLCDAKKKQVKGERNGSGVITAASRQTSDQGQTKVETKNAERKRKDHEESTLENVIILL